MTEETPLTYEIEIIKKLMKELIERPGKKTSITERMHMLDTITKASTRLANIIKTAQSLAQEKTDVQAILNTALDDVLKEMREEQTKQ